MSKLGIMLHPPHGTLIKILIDLRRTSMNPVASTCEEASGQMALGQRRPVVPRMLGQASARLDNALLQAGKRPVVDPPRQDQPPDDDSEYLRV